MFMVVRMRLVNVKSHPEGGEANRSSLPNQHLPGVAQGARGMPPDTLTTADHSLNHAKTDPHAIEECTREPSQPRGNTAFMGDFPPTQADLRPQTWGFLPIDMPHSTRNPGARWKIGDSAPSRRRVSISSAGRDVFKEKLGLAR